MRGVTPEAAERRLAILRVAVGAYTLGWLAVHSRALTGRQRPPSASFDPVGPMAILWSEPPSRLVSTSIVALCGVAAVAVASGRRGRGALVVLAATTAWLGSYRSSWGQVFHTDNLLVLHASTLALVAWGRAAASAPSRRGLVPDDALRVVQLATITTYVLSGAAKLRTLGTGWVTDDDLRHWVAYDNLRKAELGDVHSPIGAWLVAHGWVWPLLALFTLVVELGAPLALLGGRWSTSWAGLAWAFHVGVAAVMAIAFPYALLGLAFVAFLPAERWRGGRSRPSPAGSATGRSSGPTVGGVGSPGPTPARRRA